MSRFLAPLSMLLAFAACTAARPLYRLDPVPAPAQDVPVSGGKGFVSPKAASIPSPLSLTASDGSGLELISMSARAEIDDPIAVTHLDLRFDNPKDQVIEGKLQVTLPPGASITHFAMKIGERWQDAAVVERQSGRVAYEESLHQGQDPALLEKSSGNRFGVRVFPIAARGQVHLRLSYVQTFAEPTQPYRLALRGLPRVRHLDAQAGVLDPASGERVWTKTTLNRQRPTEDFVVSRHDGAPIAWRHGEHLLARVIVPSSREVAVPNGSYTVLFDTSASRAVEFGLKVERLESLLAELGARGGEAAEVTVIPFDQSVGAPVYSGPLSGYAGSDASSRLRLRGALGASNFGRALTAAAKLKHQRLVFITDGVPTAGSRDASGLRAGLRKIAEAGGQRVDVIAGRDFRDDAVLRSLVTTVMPRDGVVIDAAQPVEAVAMRLLRPTAPPMMVGVEGATRVFPETLAGVQEGDAVLIHAQVQEGATSARVTLTPKQGAPGGATLDVVRREDAEFERAWLRAHVEERLAALQAGGHADVDELAALSVEHRILNELTALIVLETDRDYARFGFKKSSPDGAPLSEREDATVERRESSMDEFRNIPVGQEAGRDFTQVVEVSATASRDAAGISLVGSTSAESSVVRLRRGKRSPRRASAVVTVSRTRGDIRRTDARSVVALAESQVEQCHFDALEAGAVVGGNMTLEFNVAGGKVGSLDLLRDGLGAPRDLRRCLHNVFHHLPFGIRGGRVRVKLAFRDGWVPERSTALVSGIPGDGRTVFEGRFGEVQQLVARHDTKDAMALARRWHQNSPDDLMALTALGRAAEADGRPQLAARAYGSIAELHPSSAPMLRFAAGRLQALGPVGLRLATSFLKEARRQRPDHPSSHRALAWVHVQRQQYEEAFEVLVEGYDHDYPAGRFASAKAALADELSVVGAAWVRGDPGRRAAVTERLEQLGLSIATDPSLRFVLTWETDANDVDLHIRDGRGNEASYNAPALRSGGDLLADVTNGFGPETFVIHGTPQAYPYDLFVHYYARGPMGYGMGQVQTVFHDGEGRLEIETLPYVVMKDDAMLGVGSVAAR